MTRANDYWSTSQLGNFKAPKLHLGILTMPPVWLADSLASMQWRKGGADHRPGERIPGKKSRIEPLNKIS